MPTQSPIVSKIEESPPSILNLVSDKLENIELKEAGDMKRNNQNKSKLLPSPNQKQLTQRKPVLNAIRMMYNMQGKANNPSENREMNVFENYSSTRQTNFHKKIKTNKTRKIMIKDMIKNAHKRHEVFNHMERITKGDHFYFMK